MFSVISTGSTHTEFVKDDPVFQVPVETISFFYEKNGAGFLLCRWFMLFLKVIHHFCEARSSRLLSGLHIDIFLDHCKARWHCFNRFEEALRLLPKEGRIKRRVDGYILSEDWEMLPGEWSLSIVYPLFALVIINSDEHVGVRTHRCNKQPTFLVFPPRKFRLTNSHKICIFQSEIHRVAV